MVSIVCAVAAAAVAASPASAARPPVAEGQPQRELLGGRWYFRPDALNVGIDYGFMHRRSLSGWLPITVPHDFNAAERLDNRSSVGWYRRDLKVGRLDADERRIVRFEGAGHFSTVYLNGRQIAKHAGGYLPFEAPLTGLRPGTNRLVVRVSSMRARTDLSHWRPGQLQRLRQRRLVELRRDPPRGVDPAGAGGGHRAGAGDAPPGAAPRARRRCWCGPR